MRTKAESIIRPGRGELCLGSVAARQLPLFHMTRKHWRPSSSDLMNLTRFAFGGDCHQQTGLGCLIYACPLNVLQRVRHGAVRDTLRLRSGHRAVQDRSPRLQESLANWEYFLSDRDSYYARLDDDTPWMPNMDPRTTK